VQLVYINPDVALVGVVKREELSFSHGLPLTRGP
jgi:hypothetical protein